MRPDDGVCSDWFDVQQRLRQGCVVSPLLLNIFFAAVLTVVIERFSEDTVSLAELAHLKEPPTSMGPKPAMYYVRRAVWGILYVGDACIASRSPKGLAKMIEVIVEVCRIFALTMSAKNTEIMCLHRVNRGRWCKSKRPGKSTSRCNPSPTWGRRYRYPEHIR